MIIDFGDSATRRFVESGKTKFSGLDEELADQRLSELHAATKLADLGALKSVGLHKLRGPLKDFWSIDINGPWRLIFKFADGNASESPNADAPQS